MLRGARDVSPFAPPSSQSRPPSRVTNNPPSFVEKNTCPWLAGSIPSAWPFWQWQSFSCLQATLRQFEARRSSSSESLVVAGRSNTPSELVPAKTDPSSPTLRTRPNPSDIFVFVQLAPSSLLTETPWVAVPAYKRSPLFASDKTTPTAGEPVRMKEAPAFLLL